MFVCAGGECTNCVDDGPALNRWTMPLLKLGEKRYYLGIFFKVCKYPMTYRTTSRTLVEIPVMFLMDVTWEIQY